MSFRKTKNPRNCDKFKSSENTLTIRKKVSGKERQ
jgi:hypothetical protein